MSNKPTVSSKTEALRQQTSNAKAEVESLQAEAAALTAKFQARQHELAKAEQELALVSKKIGTVTNQLDQIRQSQSGFANHDLTAEFSRRFVRSVITESIEEHIAEKQQYASLAIAILGKDLCLSALASAESELDAELAKLTSRQEELNAILA